jgi:hypothetical protein
VAVYLQRVKREQETSRMTPRKRVEHDAAVALGHRSLSAAMLNLHGRYNSIPYSVLVQCGIISARSLVAEDVPAQVLASAVSAGRAPRSASLCNLRSVRLVNLRLSRRRLQHSCISRSPSEWSGTTRMSRTSQREGCAELRRTILEGR